MLLHLQLLLLLLLEVEQVLLLLLPLHHVHLSLPLLEALIPPTTLVGRGREGEAVAVVSHRPCG